MKLHTKILFLFLVLASCSITYTGCGCGCSSCYSSCYNSCCDHCCDGKGCCECECRVQSRSTFVIRPQFQVCSPEYLTAYRDRMDVREDGHGGTLSLTLFGGKSRRSRKLASFFTPYCKTTLSANSINEDGKTDLIAQHFNVDLQEQNGQEQNFSSRISLCPKVNTVGLGIVYRQNLHKLLSDCYDPDERHVWIEISTPLTRQETTMGLSECITTTATLEARTVEGLDQTFYTSMKSAFNQSAWKYGKINGCCKCSKTRLADITLMGGYEFIKCSSCVAESYIGVLIPTGNKRCAKYVFEPVVGHARHWGIVKGTHIIGTVWEDDEQEWKMEFATDVHGQYLFKNDEMRSFDLKCKPWSRYMEVYKNVEQAQEAADLQQTDEEAAALLSTPGINVFTKCVSVRPRLSVTFNTAITLSSERFKGEVGYNFFGKEAECLQLCCWDEKVALKAARGEGRTNGFRTIDVNLDESPLNPRPCHDLFDTTVAVDRYECNLIDACDLDLESAAHPYYFSNTLYASLGAKWEEKEYPTFIDFGGSYEWGCANMVLNRWTIWAKFGASF